MKDLTIVGGGLAGSEAAWQAAQRGVKVTLFEMRPAQMTGAHVSGNLAELVCSNSLGSHLLDRASGLLKAEARRMGSLLLTIAEETQLPAGNSLAVDREIFSAKVTAAICSHPMIHVIEEEVTTLPDGPAIIASGPLTSPALAESLKSLTEQEHMFFYDAIAPILSLDSIDQNIVYRGSRYHMDEQTKGDYLNCPFTKEQYEAFVEELKHAERIELRQFEDDIQFGVKAGVSRYFEGCLPVEILAGRDIQALAFGPLRPVGLRNPLTGRGTYAVAQLRQDDLVGTLYNLVGFQTNLTFSEQKRVFRMIPGLESADFVRFGQMHRNTFLASPLILEPTLQYRQRSDLFFAGQITGVEGYMGNIATGLLAGINAARVLSGLQPLCLPATTMLGALCWYITHADLKDFQPMKAIFGLLPEPADKIKNKHDRSLFYAHRALKDLEQYLCEMNI